MTRDFSGQTAVVTGGTRGIGRAAVAAFLAAGADAVALYGGDDRAAGELRASYPDDGRLRVEKLDVADPGACRDFWRSLEDGGVRVDVLVNSAGIRRDSVLALMPEDDWNRVLAVNLGGAFHMCKGAVRAMSGNRYGRIVNIASPSGKFGFAGQANYAASKAGLVALTSSLAKETATRGITVNAVSPGFIDTDFIRGLPADLAGRYRQSVPVRRFGRPGEVADAILFLASREAAYITGTVLEVTGGL